MMACDQRVALVMPARWAAVEFQAEEPTVLLPQGGEVCSAVFGLITQLLAEGHTVAVNNGDVQVSPPIHEDALFVLESCWHDTTAVLEALCL